MGQRSTEGKALVMLVVLNQVWDARFPNTIEEVIMQDGAFTPVSNGRYDKVEPDADCMKAMELITVEHSDESQGALYFEKASDESTRQQEPAEVIHTHGAHTFYTEKE
ncbi:MAG: cell wall hydrolase [Clostridium sp.]